MVIPRKRPLVQAVPGKVKFWDPNCKSGIKKPERKPMKNMQKVNPKPKEFVSKPSGKVKFSDPNCMKTRFDQKPKVTTTDEPQNKALKSFNNVDTKELGRNRSYLGTKTASKVKYWDPTSEVKKPEDTTVINVLQKELIKREKIQHAMAVFDQEYELFYQENKKKPKDEQIQPCRVPMEVCKIVKQKLKWVDPGKIAGPVCGVRIGDKFKYRSQLMMVDLHSQPNSGIDYANINGENLAISIVDAHRYSNESGSSDKLVYSGQGGLSLFGSKVPPEDQKLKKDNLALKNSMVKKTKVRVIRKVKGFRKYVFAYDGLYIVDSCTNAKGAKGKKMFKFHLKRVPGQPSLHQMLK